MHDIDHPGLTNDFLVKTGHEWAILYNDHSVAENHHATAAFMMLRSASAARRLDAAAGAAPAADVNFIGAQLTTEDFRRFRYIVCECILATDMRSHFSIIGNVQVLCLRFEDEGRLHGQGEGAERGGLWKGIKERNDENDYLTVMKLLMKLSDLAHLALRRDLMLRWVDMVRRRRPPDSRIRSVVARRSNALRGADQSLRVRAHQTSCGRSSSRRATARGRRPSPCPS